jgi:hypothetical protein
LAAVLAAAGISCSILSNAQDRIGSVQQTAGAVSTQIQQGRDLVSTGQAVITQVQGNEIVQTLGAFVTEEGSVLLETAQAFATEEGPGLLATAQAFATEQGPEMLETAQALLTQEGPGLVQTGQALLTQVVIATPGPGDPGTAGVPADIPLVESDQQDFTHITGSISYSTGENVESTLQFYETQMPANGWSKVQEGSLATEQGAVLNYTKDDRRVTILLSLLPATGRTQVLITYR